jgi:general secretion pathway protein D
MLFDFQAAVCILFICIVRRSTITAMRLPRAALITLALAGLPWTALASPPHSESAASLYRQGRASEDRDDVIAAYQAYQEAFKLVPKEIRYRAAWERMRFAAATEYVHQGEAAMQANDLATALVRFMKALDADPGNELAAQDLRATQAKLQSKDKGQQSASDVEMPRTAPPPQLELTSHEAVTLHMEQQADVLYQAIAKTAGINVLIDPTYTPKRVTMDVRDVTAFEALRILGQLSGTFWKPVTRNTIFVAEDTRAKRLTLDEHAVQIFYLSNVSQQSDLNDIQTALRNLMQGTRIYGVNSLNAIAIYGTPDELMLARQVIAALDKPRPEVVVDITVMEASRDRLRNLGLSPPTSFTATASSTATLSQIGQGSAYTFTVGEAAADLLLTDSDTRILQSPRIRATDGQKASLKIGERLPVATGSFSSAASTAISSVETQFQYVDVGVNVEMTPTIHGDRDVSMKLGIEVSAESSTQTIDSVTEPVISQQKSEQSIRLKDGEVSILAGLVKRQVSKNVSGTPGLASLPLVKYLFSTQSNEVVDDEIVFMIVPHVVRAHSAAGSDSQQIDVGSGNGIQLRPIVAEPREGEAPPAGNSTSPEGAAKPPATPNPL